MKTTNDIQTAIVIHENGNETKHFPAKGKKFDFTELQKFVGGYIESLSSFRYKGTGKLVKQVYCNEDGIAKGLSPNPIASDMWEGGKTNARFFGERNPIVLGPVVMIFPRDPSPDFTIIT